MFLDISRAVQPKWFMDVRGGTVYLCIIFRIELGPFGWEDATLNSKRGM